MLACITSLGSGMEYLGCCHLLQTRALGSEPQNLGTEQDCEATFCSLPGPACLVIAWLPHILSDMTLPPSGSVLHVGHRLSAATA